MARPTLFQHKKFLLLCRKLGDEAAALGYLEFIWAAGNESGDPHFSSEESLEATARWRGEDGRLAALLIGQFVDRLEDGTLEIHDFWDHCPDYVRRRLTRETERRTRGAERRKLANSDRSVAGQRLDSDRSTEGEKAPPTAERRKTTALPTPNSQPPTPKKKHSPLTLASERDPDFERFLAFFPRKAKPQDAWKAWRQVAAVRPPLPDLLIAIQGQVAACEDLHFFPYPATWLRAHSWKDEPIPRGGNGKAPPLTKHEAQLLAENRAILGAPEPAPPEGIEDWTSWEDEKREPS